MTSMAERLGDRAPSLAEVRSAVTEELVTRLQFDGVEEHRPSDAWAVAGIARPADTSKQAAQPNCLGPLGGASAW
jgi:hypothetical protein